MGNKNSLLVTLADRNYIQQAKQLFSSVYWNGGWKGDYLLLCHDIPKEELDWFNEKNILIFICDPLYFNRCGEHNYPPVILDKLYLFSEYFKKWESVVYLDSDIIVKGYLKALKKVKCFNAVQDLYVNKLNSQFMNPNNNTYNNIVYNLEKPAFNSGVFAFNTQVISTCLFDELKDMLNKHIEDFKYPDQALLNLVFYNKWKKLPSVYNMFLVCHKNYKTKKIKGIVLHFLCSPKDHIRPWDKESIYYSEWKFNLDKAEEIDLSINIKGLKLGFSVLKCHSEVFLMRLLVFINKVYFDFLNNFFDKNIGMIGRYIKKISPELYRRLKL